MLGVPVIRVGAVSPDEEGRRSRGVGGTSGRDRLADRGHGLSKRDPPAGSRTRTRPRVGARATKELVNVISAGGSALIGDRSRDPARGRLGFVGRVLGPGPRGLRAGTTSASQPPWDRDVGRASDDRLDLIGTERLTDRVQAQLACATVHADAADGAERSAAKLHRHDESVSCPRCKLVIMTRMPGLAPRHCPRCLARRRLAVELEAVPTTSGRTALSTTELAVRAEDASHRPDTPRSPGC